MQGRRANRSGRSVTHWKGCCFFVTILFAALTSSVSLIEVGVAYLTEERRMKRGWACVLLFFVTGAVGGLCSLSFGPLSHVKVFGLGLFDFADTFASNVLLTLGGLLAVLFVGWKMSRPDVYDEFTNGGVKVWNVRLFNFFWFLHTAAKAAGQSGNLILTQSNDIGISHCHSLATVITRFEQVTGLLFSLLYSHNNLF